MGGKLYLIAGHGNGDPGACSNGFQEAERVRKLCECIKKHGGDNVVYLEPSRNWYADNGISSLNLNKDDFLMECHMDSASKTARGGHVIICAGLQPDQYDKALADMLEKYLPGRADMISDRGNLANPKRAKNRGINYRLVEFGFISNAEDLKVFNEKMEQIAIAVLSCFGIAATEEKTDIKSSPFKTKVNRDNLNFRTGPGTEYPSHGYLPKGTYNVVDTKEADGYTWGKVEGWIALNYTEKA